MKFVNNKNETIDKALLNGYWFGDRLLEGVMFECIIENDKVKVLGVRESDKRYFDGLNKKKWLDLAQAHIDDSIDEGECCFANCDLEIE